MILKNKKNITNYINKSYNINDNIYLNNKNTSREIDNFELNNLKNSYYNDSNKYYISNTRDNYNNKFKNNREIITDIISNKLKKKNNLSLSNDYITRIKIKTIKKIENNFLKVRNQITKGVININNQSILEKLSVIKNQTRSANNIINDSTYSYITKVKIIKTKIKNNNAQIEKLKQDITESENNEYNLSLKIKDIKSKIKQDISSEFSKNLDDKRIIINPLRKNSKYIIKQLFLANVRNNNRTEISTKTTYSNNNITTFNIEPELKDIKNINDNIINANKIRADNKYKLSYLKNKNKLRKYELLKLLKSIDINIIFEKGFIYFFKILKKIDITDNIFTDYLEKYNINKQFIYEYINIISLNNNTTKLDTLLKEEYYYLFNKLKDKEKVNNIFRLYFGKEKYLKILNQILYY